jgi:hypothetical protein
MEPAEQEGEKAKTEPGKRRQQNLANKKAQTKACAF